MAKQTFIGFTQINPQLADFKNNANLILEKIQEAAKKNCDLLVFPECALFGYHPFDLLERPEFIDEQLKELDRVHKKIPKDIAVLIGLIVRNPKKMGRPFYNAVAMLEKGKAPKFFYKTLLPTGDVFDEARFIASGDLKKNIFKWKGRKYLLTICEDIWAWPENGVSAYRENPLLKIKKQKFDLIINMSASPWYMGKLDQRIRVARETAKYFKSPLVYTNMVGAQDEIIFDGQSFILDAKGKLVFKSVAFQEALNIFELKTLKCSAPASENLDPIEDLRRAIVLGLRDFVKKVGIEKVHLGLSGGIDSAVVACLAADALGPKSVECIALPGPYSLPESLDLATKLAKNLGVGFKKINIDESYNSLLKNFEKEMGDVAFGVTQENLQSRVRGIFLMAYSNLKNSMLLNTTNKSEFATGYGTLYGDLCGGLSILGDCTKAYVYELAKLYNQQSELIPKQIITRAPSAELRPNQKDQDSLPEYAVLDQAVENIVEKCAQPKNKVEEWTLQKIYSSEFKRWQSPPILKVTSHSFGRGRRYPIAFKK